MSYADLQQLAKKIRLATLEMIYKSQAGHTGSALSFVEILTALYFGSFEGRPIVNLDPQKPLGDNQDYIVLSYPPAAPALYACLAERGFFPSEECTTFQQLHSTLQGFPFRKTPGVVLSSGAAGHGLAASVGLSLALRADRAMHRVYAVVSDTELQDGLSVEAALYAAEHKLDHLCVILSHSDLQRDGSFYAGLFEGFGWRTFRVADGHNIEELTYGLAHARRNQRAPTVIIADTVLGKGLPFAEGKLFYAHVSLSAQEMDTVRRILQSDIAPSLDLSS